MYCTHQFVLILHSFKRPTSPYYNDKCASCRYTNLRGHVDENLTGSTNV